MSESISGIEHGLQVEEIVEGSLIAELIPGDGYFSREARALLRTIPQLTVTKIDGIHVECEGSAESVEFCLTFCIWEEGSFEIELNSKGQDGYSSKVYVSLLWGAGVIAFWCFSPEEDIPQIRLNIYRDRSLDTSTKRQIKIYSDTTLIELGRIYALMFDYLGAGTYRIVSSETEFIVGKDDIYFRVLLPHVFPRLDWGEIVTHTNWLATKVSVERIDEEV